MAEIAKSKSLSSHGQPVSVTIHSVGSTKPGADTSGIGKNIEIAQIGKSPKEKSKEKATDGQRKGEKSESAKLLDHVIESTASSKKKDAQGAPGDFRADETSSKQKPDSMSDFTQGRTFKPRQSGAQQRKKAKEKDNE